MYELNMLLRTGKRIQVLQNQDESDDRDFERNVCLESFLIHGRNLRHFLLAHEGWKESRVREDDVLATDFNPSWKPKRNPVIEKWVKEEPHWRVAHLSYRRQGVDDKQWPIGKIAQAFKGEMEAFFYSMKSGDLHPDRQSQARDILDTQIPATMVDSTTSVGPVPTVKWLRSAPGGESHGDPR